MKPPQGHTFSNEITRIGDDEDATCKICVNCSVTGNPEPLVTWEYQPKDMPGSFYPVVTNQSGPYFVENNGQVSVTYTYCKHYYYILLQKLCYIDIRN